MAALDPYAPPSTEAQSSAVVDAPVDDLSDDEIVAFVENNWLYYHTRWRRILEGNGWGGFNWVAGWLSVAWLGYRRMWRELTVLFLMALFLGMIEGAVASQLRSADARLLTRITQFGLMGAFGAVANRLYLRRARIVVASSRARGLSKAERMAWLRRKGGVSVIGCVMAILVSLGFAGLGVLADQLEPETPEEPIGAAPM